MEFQMTKLSLIALASLVVAGGFAAPALAATTVPAGNVPYCSSGSDSELDVQKDNLATQLQLDSKPGSSIDVWNGCLKVITTEAGTTTIAFYDPDSLRLIAEV
jgi:hypothetical protein